MYGHAYSWKYNENLSSYILLVRRRRRQRSEHMNTFLKNKNGIRQNRTS